MGNMDAPPVTPPEIDEDPFEETEFDRSYERDVKALPDNVRVIVEKLAFKIKRDGLTIDEACLLCNIDTEWLSNTMDKHPVIARIFAKKELEYRVELMRPLNRKAKSDDKMAQYLLELKNPRPRKNAAGAAADDSGDMLAMVISHIQEHGDSTPLVRRESGAAVVMSTGARATGLVNKLKNMLPKEALK